MSQTIDNRIVEMQFDNKQFESGVSESLSTLDKLKQALKFDDASKNLDNFGKNVSKNIDLSGLSKSVEDLNSKFSLSGIAGIEAIRKLTDFAIEAGKTIAHALDAPFKQIREGGWKRAMNIEDAKFQLKGLNIEWDTVFGSINEAVADTAFGLDAAAKACSQLSASGVQAGEDMTRALRGISGVAAMGNTEYENIADIFTKAAGNGKVMAMELNRISQYGLNARASLAKFFNAINAGDESVADIPEKVKKRVKDITDGVKVTEADISEFASKSKIDFQTFSYAMDNAFGAHAKAANETFMGSLRNIKAALSKIGAEFAAPIIHGAIPVFNEIRIFLNDLRKHMGPVFDVFKNIAEIVSGKLTKGLQNFRYALLNWGALDHIGNAIKNVFTSVIKIFVAVKDAFEKVFPPAHNFARVVESVTSSIEDFSKHLVISDEAMITFRNVMIVVFNIIKGLGTIVKAILPVIGKVVSMALKVINVVVTIIAYLTTLISKLDLVKYAMNAIQSAGGLFAYAIEKVKDAFYYLKDVLSDTSTITGQVFAKIKDAAMMVAYVVGGSLYLAFMKLKEIFGYFDTHDPLGSIIQGAKSLITTFKSLPILNTIISGMQKAFGVVALIVSKVVGLIKDFFNNLKSGMSIAHAIGNTLSSVFVGVIGVIGNLIDKITSLFSIFKKDRIIEEEVIMPINGANNALVGIEKTLTKTTDGVKKTSTSFEKGRNAITNFGSAIIDKIKTIRAGQVLLFAFGTTVTILAANLIKLTQSFTRLTGSVTNAVNGIGYFFRTFGQKRTSFSEAMIAISIAIGAMTASLWALSKIPTRKLIEVAGVLEVLLITMGTFSIIGKNGAGPFASAMISFSGGILLLVSALYALDQINMENIEKKWATLAIISGIVLTVSIILSKAAPQLSRGGIGLLAFAGAVYILAKALDIISHSDLNNIKENWIELSAVIIAFAAFASLVSNVGIAASLGLIGFIAVLKLLSKHTETIKKNFANIQDTFKMVADALKGAIKYLYNGLKTAAEDMKQNETFAKLMAGSATAVIATLLGFILAMGHAGKGIKKAAVGFAIILAAIAGVMYVMAKVSEMIKAINDPAAIKIATNILYSLLIFIGVLATIGTIRDKIKIEDGVNTLKDVRKLMTSLAILLLAIGGLAAMVGTLSEDEFKRAERMIVETEVIIGIIATFCTLITAVASKAGKSEVSFGTFAGIVALLGGLLGSIAVLMFMFSQVDWEKDRQQLITAGIAFGGIIVSIIAIMGMLSLLTKQASKDGSMKAALILGAFVGVIVAIAGVIYALNKQIKNKEELKRAGAIAGGIIAFLTILSTLVVVLEKVSAKLLNTEDKKDAFKKTFNTLLVMLGAVVAFGVGLYALRTVDAGRMWGQVTAIITALTAITSLVLALQYFSKQTKFSITKKSQSNLIKSLIMISAFIIAFKSLAKTFKSLSDVDAGRMWGQVTALIFTLTTLSGLAEAIIFLVKKMKTGWGDLAKAGTILGGMTAIFTALTLIFKHIVNDINTDGLVAKIHAITLTLLELEVLAFIASSFGENIKEVGLGELALLGMVGIFWALSEVFTVIDGLKIKGILAKSQSIILVMLELEVLAVGAAALGALVEGGGLLLLGEVGLIAMVGIFWALSEVFTIIDGLKTEGIMKKSQTIILVLLELEVLGTLSILTLPALVGGIGLIAMVGIFAAISQVFEVIDGIKVEGIMAKSQTIILVLLELEVLGTLSILTLPALAGAPGLDAMVEIFGKLAVVFTIINTLNTDGLLAKSQAIILVLLELEGLSVLSILGVIALAGAPGLDAMVDVFGKLAIIFTLLNGLQLEGMSQKADILIETISKLAGMGLEGFVNSFGLEDLAEALQELTNVIFELTNQATTFSLSITTMSSSLMMLLTTGPQLVTWSESIKNALTTVQTSLSTSANTIINIINNMIDGIVHSMNTGRIKIEAEAEKMGKSVETGFNKNLKPDLWGSELVAKFANGIRSKIKSVADAAASIAHTVWEYLHFSGGPEKGAIAGNSLQIYGMEGAQMYGQGWTNGIPDIENAISGITGTIKNAFTNIDLNGLVDVGGLLTGEGDLMSKLNGILQAIGLVKGELGSLHTIGHGTKDDFLYQLQGSARGLEKELDRCNTASTRLSSNGTRSGENAKKKAAEVQKQLDGVNAQILELTTGVKQATPEVKELGEGLGGLGEGGKAGKEGMTEIKDEIADFYDSIEGAISLFQEFNKQTELTSDQLLSNMRSQIEGISEWSSQIQKLAFMGIDQGLLKELADMGPQGYEYTNAFVHMTADQLAEANNLYHQSLMLPAKVTSQIYGSFTVAGRSAASGFLMGMDREQIKAHAVGFAHDVVDQMNLALDIQSGKSMVAYQDGVAVINGIKTGISAGNMQTAIKSLTDNDIKGGIDNGLFHPTDHMYTVGQNITEGIANGIENPDAKDKAKKSVENLCGMIIMTAENMFQEKSPSRVFKKIGSFLTQGLAIGITDETQSAVSAMNTTSEEIIDTMRETINKANEALVDGVNDPVITPVLDLSEIQNGSRQLDNMLSRNSAFSAGRSFTDLQNQQWGSQTALLNATMDNTDVVGAIASLSDDINTLKEAMTNIKMVLDTGTMVGAMTPAIDQQLGVRQVLAGRGI